jgi:hypothetical protein
LVLLVWDVEVLYSLMEVDVLGQVWQVRVGWVLMDLQCFWISVVLQHSEWMDILVGAFLLVLLHQDDVFSVVLLPQIQAQIHQCLVELFLVPLESEGETVVG